MNSAEVFGLLVIIIGVCFIFLGLFSKIHDPTIHGMVYAGVGVIILLASAIIGQYQARLGGP